MDDLYLLPKHLYTLDTLIHFGYFDTLWTFIWLSTLKQIISDSCRILTQRMGGLCTPIQCVIMCVLLQMIP